MTEPFVLLATALMCLLIGSALALLLTQGRVRAAAEQSRAQAASDLAVAKEQLRLHTEERVQLQAQAGALQADVERWRAAFDASGLERAQLAERASRVVGLEQRIGELEQAAISASSDLTNVREDMARYQAELQAEREAHAATTRRLQGEQAARQSADGEVGRLTTELAQLVTQQAADREQFKEKLTFIDEAKRSLSDQFKNLANDILEEKGKRFAEQNQSNLGSLLDPLRQKLAEFQGKVEDVYVKEGKDRSALAEQVRQLMGLNQSLSEDAKNLTSALKGSNKTQGNWGEMVLEQLLESSGLRKGHEFHPQNSHTQEDGRRLQPDVIISLPEQRSLVVDAKVSLNAYEECTTAGTDDEREAALRRHLASMRNHIKNLSGKNYQAMYQLQSLDFALMFIPIEPAFIMAINAERGLFQEAWERNVLLVSPSTLMFVLRTVAHLWRQEAQNRNAQDIAKRGAELYDKLCGFTHELAKVGTSINQAKNSYEEANKKLIHGKGSVIRQAEMLRDLGIKPTKILAPAISRLAQEGGEESMEAAGLRLTAGEPPAEDSTELNVGKPNERRIRPG